MALYNERSIKKVITGLYRNNDLLVDGEYPLKLDDFILKKYQAIYTSLYNLYILGNSHIDISDIIGYFQQNSGMYAKFVEEGGMDILYEICNDNIIDNDFKYNYTLVKKYTLLNELIKNGIDISDIYDISLPPEELEKQIAHFNAIEIDDIFKHYTVKLNNIQSSYENFLEKTCISAGDGIDDLLKQLQSSPEIGMPIDGDIYNTITRGARLKKLYIDSRPSGAGKSRSMVGNACRLAIPVYYDQAKEEWINTGSNNKVLYITMELEHSEIQTMILSYVSGVNEEKILNNKCDEQEKERVEMAAMYIQANNNIIIEYMPDPTITMIKTIIKKHALQDNIIACFYDYIAIGNGLMLGRDKQTRDDVLLLLLTNTLKELANELDIFIFSSTQLSGDWAGAEVKNETLIRGMRRKCLNIFLPFIDGVYI